MQQEQFPEVTKTDAAKPIGRKSDLNEIIADPRYEIKVEPKESDDDAHLRRQKERWIFVTAIGLAVACLVAVGLVFAFGSPNDTDKRWLQSVITLVVGALIGRALK